MPQIAVGQQYELPSVGVGDPLVLVVVEVVGADRAVVRTVRRSQPDVVIDRSTMHVRDLVDAGVLVRGPGALDARRRRARNEHLKQLLIYAAQREGASSGGEVRFDGRDVVGMVADDEGVSIPEARAMIRSALAELEGREITSAYDPTEIGYVLPVTSLP